MFWNDNKYTYKSCVKPTFYTKNSKEGLGAGIVHSKQILLLFGWISDPGSLNQLPALISHSAIMYKRMIAHVILMSYLKKYREKSTVYGIVFKLTPWAFRRMLKKSSTINTFWGITWGRNELRTWWYPAPLKW